jgi:hypothetical protein
VFEKPNRSFFTFTFTVKPRWVSSILDGFEKPPEPTAGERTMVDSAFLTSTVRPGTFDVVKASEGEKGCAVDVPRHGGEGPLAAAVPLCTCRCAPTGVPMHPPIAPVHWLRHGGEESIAAAVPP